MLLTTDSIKVFPIWQQKALLHIMCKNIANNIYSSVKQVRNEY